MRSDATEERRRGGPRRARLLLWGGALASLIAAIALFSRFSLDERLSRDEAIYAYGGQQQADGIPFYVSIFDAKTPLSPMIAGAAVAAGRAIGVDDLDAIRVVFFGFACLSVVAVYVLATWLFGSALAGLVSAATLAAFKGFALDALGGPSAKHPGILFALLSMALVARRRYFSGALTGSLAFLVWQPLAVYAAVAVLGAALTGEPGRRWRRVGEAAAGAAIPIVLTAAYFWLADALDDLVAGAFVFPVTHLNRADLSVGERLARAVAIADRHYDGGELLLWGGLAILVGLLALRVAQRASGVTEMVKGDPYVNVVFASFLPTAVFLAIDFQGYQDVYPLLPYAALGIGGAAALVLSAAAARAPRAGAAAVAAAVVVLVTASWVSYSGGAPTEGVLVEQRADAGRIERLLDGGTLYALGNATPLVLTGRRNPSPYIYLSSGVDAWVVDHSDGGFAGWTREIRAHNPSVIVVGGPWRTRYSERMRAWLRQEYAGMRVGVFRVFVPPAVRERAEREGLVPRRRASGGRRR